MGSFCFFKTQLYFAIVFSYNVSMRQKTTEKFAICIGKEKIKNKNYLLFQDLEDQNNIYSFAYSSFFSHLPQRIFSPDQPKIFIVSVDEKEVIHHLYSGYACYDDYRNGRKAKHFHKKIMAKIKDLFL
jgi:hypothetical protein